MRKRVNRGQVEASPLASRISPTSLAAPSRPRHLVHFPLKVGKSSHLRAGTILVRAENTTDASAEIKYHFGVFVANNAILRRVPIV